MTRTLLALVVVFGSLYPAAAQNFAGPIAPLGAGPAGVQLSAACVSPITASLCRLEWDFGATETAPDATQPPGAPPVLVTPTPARAAALLYRVRSLGGPNGFAAERIPKGVTCDLTGCRTPFLNTFIPELTQGGSWVIVLTRDGSPQFRESTNSDPVVFTTINEGGPILPPPPPGAASPDCTRWVSITDASGRVWTLVNGQTFRDGVWIGRGTATEYFWASQVVYAHGQNSFWYQWTGSGWAGANLPQICPVGPPIPPPPPPPPPPVDTLKQQIQRMLTDLAALIASLP